MLCNAAITGPHLSSFSSSAAATACFIVLSTCHDTCVYAWDLLTYMIHLLPDTASLRGFFTRFCHSTCIAGRDRINMCYHAMTFSPLPTAFRADRSSSYYSNNRDYAWFACCPKFACSVYFWTAAPLPATRGFSPFYLRFPFSPAAPACNSPGSVACAEQRLLAFSVAGPLNVA